MCQYFDQPDRAINYGRLCDQWALLQKNHEWREEGAAWREEAAAWRLVDLIERENPVTLFDRLLLLKGWLEGEAKAPIPIEIRDGSVPSWTVLSSPLTPLDPDGAAEWHPEDKAYEEAVWKNLFGLLRVGRLDQAIQTCLAIKQPWKAALLQGGIYGHNPHRIEWRHAVKKVHAQSIAERACLGALIGDEDAMRPLCQATWQDRLWMRLLCHLDHLIATGREAQADAGHIFTDPEATLIEAIIAGKDVVNARFAVHWRPNETNLIAWIEHLCANQMQLLCPAYLRHLAALNSEEAVLVSGSVLLSCSTAKSKGEVCRLMRDCLPIFDNVMAAMVHTCLSVDGSAMKALEWLHYDPQPNMETMLSLANQLIRQGLEQRDPRSPADVTPAGMQQIKQVLSLIAHQDVSKLQPSRVVREHAYLRHAVYIVEAVAAGQDARQALEDLLTCDWMMDVDPNDELRGWIIPKAIEWLCMSYVDETNLEKERILSVIQEVLEKEAELITPISSMLLPIVNELLK